MKNEYLIHNGVILVNDSWQSNSSILIRDGIIQSVFTTSQDIPSKSNDNVFDADGMYIVPGFIDSHTYGAGGVSTYSGDKEALSELQKIYPQYGVTSFMASVPSTSCDAIQKAANACRSAMKSKNNGAKILGLFSEGICVNPQKRGAQVQNSDICPINRFIEILYEYPDVFKIVTLAPEMEKCSPVLDACFDLGIIPSFGHSGATYQQAVSSFKTGYSHVTHLYNAMGGLVEDSGRSPGPVIAALDNDDVYTEIIADGFHVTPQFIKIAIKMKSPDKIILVTDSMEAAGTGFIGRMNFAGQEVIVTSEVALLESGRPAASILTLDKGVRNVVHWGYASLIDAIKMVTNNPANLLSLQKCGKIAEGFLADIVAIDRNLKVQATWCQGNLAYKL